MAKSDPSIKMPDITFAIVRLPRVIALKIYFLRYSGGLEIERDIFGASDWDEESNAGSLIVLKKMDPVGWVGRG